MSDSYGNYILDTGKEIEAWEQVFNRYFYESRFRMLDSPIIDLGPGRCAFTRQAPERVVAVDNAPLVVDHFSSMGLDVRLGSAYELPFEDGSVSALYSCWLLEHLDRPLDCLVEVHRTLKQGGYACFIVPSAESLQRGFYDDYTHLRPYTPASLSQLAEESGFARHKVRYLFWTRGLRRILPYVGEERVLSILRRTDRISQRSRRLVNRQNLVFEAWA